MARKLQVQCLEAVHHARGRGGRREAIFHDAQDRQLFLASWGKPSRGLVAHGGQVPRVGSCPCRSAKTRQVDKVRPVHMAMSQDPGELDSGYVAEGKLQHAIEALEHALSLIPWTPFHQAIGPNDFLALAEKMSTHLAACICSLDEPQEVEAIYLELGEIEINPHDWICRVYPCKPFVNPNYNSEKSPCELLDVPTVPWPESTPYDAFLESVQWQRQCEPFHLEGCPQLRVAFRDFDNLPVARRTPPMEEAFSITSVLLIRRFQQLVQEVHCNAKDHHLDFGRLPIISAGYGDETFFVSL